jgi:phage terminase large subunit
MDHRKVYILINEIKITDPQTGQVICFDFTDNHNQHAYFNALFLENLNIKQDYTEFAYFGGFRSGKSFSQQLAAWLICVTYKNARVLFIRDTYDQLKDSVIKQFVDDFERFGQFRLVDREARFSNGSIIKFRTFEKDTNILSTEYDMICVCQVEDIPEELFLQLLGRLSGTRLGSPVLLVEGNPAPNYVKRRYKDQSIDALKDKKIFCIPDGKTMDNKKNIASGYIERLKENYPTWWFNRYVLSEWDNYSDLVFSEFKDDIIGEMIDPEKIPVHWRKAQGMDYGFVHPTAILWAYKDYDGHITIWDEYYESKQLPEDIAKNAKRHKQYDKSIIVADFSIKNTKTGTAHRPEKTLWDDMVDFGLHMTECNKDEYRNILMVNQLMKQKRLTITKNCVNLLNEIKGYKWKQAKLGGTNVAETPVDRENDAIDSMLYLLNYLQDGVDAKDKDEEKAWKQSLAYHTTHVKRDLGLLG